MLPGKARAVARDAHGLAARGISRHRPIWECHAQARAAPSLGPKQPCPGPCATAQHAPGSAATSWQLKRCACSEGFPKTLCTPGGVGDAAAAGEPGAAERGARAHAPVAHRGGLRCGRGAAPDARARPAPQRRPPARRDAPARMPYSECPCSVHSPGVLLPHEQHACRPAALVTPRRSGWLRAAARQTLSTDPKTLGGACAGRAAAGGDRPDHRRHRHGQDPDRHVRQRARRARAARAGAHRAAAACAPAHAAPSALPAARLQHVVLPVCFLTTAGVRTRRSRGAGADAARLHRLRTSARVGPSP